MEKSNNYNSIDLFKTYNGHMRCCNTYESPI